MEATVNYFNFRDPGEGDFRVTFNEYLESVFGKVNRRISIIC